MKSQSLRKKISIMCMLTILLGSAPLMAGDPEYSKFDFEKVPALEIKGFYNDDGYFYATDIETLPAPRRPKLRGEIDEVDFESNRFKLFGLSIQIDDNTQFIGSDDDEYSIESLKVGRRIEVTCNYDEDDQDWEARKIRLDDVKNSNKIKGTLTGYSIDNNPPDTLEIYDLFIVMDRKTDINDSNVSESEKLKKK